MGETLREIDVFLGVYDIFMSNGWNVRAESKEVLKNYLELLSNLESEQRELILDLTKRYVWITYSQYEELFFQVIEQIDIERVENCSRIVVLPIIRPEDVGKVKSSFPILYFFKSFALLTRPLFAQKAIEVVENVADIQNGVFKIKDSDLIIMVDDFLGSGETVEAALKEVFKIREISNTQIVVFSLVALQMAIDFLNKYEIYYTVNIILERAISDFYQSPEKEEKIRIMEEIESMIQGNHYKFGYNNSEALITMVRTPDNTFPIFWKKYKKNNKIFLPPFIRYNI